MALVLRRVPLQCTQTREETGPVSICSIVRVPSLNTFSLDSCTQTDPALLDACVASAIDGFLTSLDASATSSFDYGAVASSINSIAQGLTSYGVTMSSLPDPATFTGAASTYSGPVVSDIVSSYSAYTATRTGTDGSGFSFDTTSFQATRSTTGMYPVRIRVRHSHANLGQRQPLHLKRTERRRSLRAQPTKIRPRQQARQPTLVRWVSRPLP